MNILIIMLFVVLGSAQDVFLGHLFVKVDPTAVMFFTFLIALVVLQVGFFVKKPNTISQLVHNKKNLIILNCITALNWIAFFVSLKYIEPAIAGAISFSVGPVLTTTFGSFVFSSKPRPNFYSWFGSVGILITSAFLAYCSISGHSAFKTSDGIMAAFGVLLALLAGVGMVLNTFVSKSLSRSELTTQTITAFRFLILVVLSGVVLFFDGHSLGGLSAYKVLSITIVAIFGIVIPMTLIQVGVKGSEPKIVSALLSLTPAITLVFERLDSRLAVSPMSFFGVLGLSVCAVLIARI